MMFLLGLIFGYIIAITTIAVTYIVIKQNRSAIVRGLDKAVENADTTVFRTREKMAVIKRKTEAEEAYEHVKKLNEDRGGIPDSELL